MNLPEQKLSATGMLLMISIPLWLFVYWQVQQLVVRHDMEEKLEHARLQTIRVAVNAVQWYEKNKEIVVDGRLFDVKSQSISNGIATFTGLFDDEETAIRQQVNRLLQQQQEKNESGIMVEYLFLNVYFEESRLLFNHPFHTKGTLPMPTNDNSIPDVFLSRVFPPPKV